VIDAHEDAARPADADLARRGQHDVGAVLHLRRVDVPVDSLLPEFRAQFELLGDPLARNEQVEIA